MDIPISESLIHNFNCLEKQKQEEILQFYRWNFLNHIFKFPFSVREKFWQFVEYYVCYGNVKTVEHGWNPKNPDHLAGIIGFLDNMIVLMGKVLEDFSVSATFTDEVTKTIENFKEYKVKDAQGLFNHIRMLLSWEMAIIEDVKMKKKIDELDILVAEAKSTLDNFKNNMKNGSANTAAIDYFDKQIERNYTQIKQFVGGELIPKLLKWKQEHQRMSTKLFFSSGQPILFNTISLEHLQVWCDAIATLIWTSYEQLKAAEEFKSNFRGRALHFCVLLRSLMSNCFIAEDHPQKIKTKNLFKERMRTCLLTWQIFLKHFKSTEVRVFLIDQELAKTYQGIDIDRMAKAFEDSMKNEKFKKMPLAPTCRYMSKARLDYDSSSQRLTATFDNRLKLERIERPNDPEHKRASEKKYCFYFVCDIQMGDLPLFRLSTISLPVAVRTHGSQDYLAMATIAWDNAFANVVRKPFEVTHEAPWYEIEHILNSKFVKDAGRGLTKENLLCLRNKAFKNQSGNSNNLNGMISWNALKKTRDGHGEVPFWKCFHSALKLITSKNAQLKTLWEKGYIVGFIDKNSAERILLEMGVIGTFLLRFSDSVEGAISVVVLVKAGTVAHVAPFDTNVLENKHLARILKEMIELEKLYLPGREPISKDEAFGENYATGVQQRGRGYVSLKEEKSLPTESLPSEEESISPESAHSDSGFSDSDSDMNSSDNGGQIPRLNSPVDTLVDETLTNNQSLYDGACTLSLLLDDLSPALDFHQNNDIVASNMQESFEAQIQTFPTIDNTRSAPDMICVDTNSYVFNQSQNLRVDQLGVALHQSCSLPSFGTTFVGPLVYNTHSVRATGQSETMDTL